MKTCRWCAEEIQDEALVCRYCGRNQSETISSIPVDHRVATPPRVTPLAGILALVGASLLVAGSLTDFGDGFSLVDFERQADQLIGDLLFWWLPPAIGVVAGVLLLTSRRYLATVSAGIGAADGLFTAGNAIGLLLYGDSPGLGFALSIIGSAVLLAGGIIAIASGAQRSGTSAPV